MVFIINDVAVIFITFQIAKLKIGIFFRNDVPVKYPITFPGIFSNYLGL